MGDNYPKAYKEVIEILNFVPKESVEKIPRTMINTFKTNMDINHDFKVDINKSFEEQDLLEETKAIFANIFRDYWATPYQKEKIEEKEKYDELKLEQLKRELYNSDEIFKRKNSSIKNEQIVHCNEKLLVEKPKNNIFKKIVSLIKSLIKNKKVQ